ncbi:la-related protein 6A-like [Typha angustifolia]|uniref:la-related protein 6A-like n=1 Tax=Typha angustifolia TaxID=59011 RepID=UPI003C2F19AA
MEKGSPEPDTSSDSTGVLGFREEVSSSAVDLSPMAEIAPPPPPAAEYEEKEPSLVDPLLQSEVFADAPQEQDVTLNGVALLSDELREQIVRQVEYYFSDENLPTDQFLLKFVKKGKEGFVPIALVASFRRMKKLVQDLSLLEAALRTSSQLVVSLDGKKVKRLHPLPVTDSKSMKLRTVIVENLPENCSTEHIQKIFGKIGNILNITIHDPHSVDGAATKRSESKFSSKVHALVEYQSPEAAEAAVATLNDKKNWRSGMRVEQLSKRMEKHGLFQKGDKETIFKKKNDNQGGRVALDREKIKSGSHQDETEEEQTANAKGGRRNRHKNRGHGYVPAGSTSEFTIKPIPGPRMPDGTRGFAVGRGKPINSEDKTSNQDA